MYPSEQDKEFFFQVLERYEAGTASPREKVFAERYLEMLNSRGPELASLPDAERRAVGDEIYQKLHHAMEADRETVSLRPVYGKRRIWTAAAAAVLLAGIGYSLYSVWQRPIHTVAAQQDVQPGHAGAVLTLADGSQVVLDSLHNGVVATQGGAAVNLRNGQLIYNVNAHTKQTVYNTMSTPRGRQYQLVLPDGSKVWLNAASSLTYPVAFDGTERKVKVSGEAYFEVASQTAPFRVEVNDGTEIQVLGTHFNVNAYPDEASINATLLQGAVRIVTRGASQLLHPGEQAQVPANATYIKLEQNVDLQAVTAWKDGSFAFNHADLKTVMRQLARWYDIEVVFDGNVPEGSYSGEIDRSLTLDQVLKGLSKTRLNYKIENGRKLVIRP
ncbi:iron dicitrate transport regulator FecR [Chitinophaga parva]|uniref:Iron dicitrate transport regulator FecR n=1 Tax=Chitinophaga parva TaxID=2169414 RepID=A0A2T7BHL9_9BACT|nr:FecR family protein [Chitinophaga parva]PUZ25774.1 iron dicitrate transport regulator FecR [Chitinophaga parva]